MDKVIPLKDRLEIVLKKVFDTRYGENPHQKGGFYVDQKEKDPLAVQNFKKLQGKQLSFNNILDIDAVVSALSEIENGKPCCVVVKHTNPCGAAYGRDIREAYLRAWYKGDSLAAFGGIIGLNRRINRKLAEAMIKNFFEILLAPAIDLSALKIFSKKPKIRILVNPYLRNPKRQKGLDIKRVRGGFLLQTPDTIRISKRNIKPVTKKKPSETQLKDLLFAWKICKVSKSNAVVLAKEETLISSGVGQQDRKRACQLAVEKAGGRARGGVAASDGFFPFPDGPEILIRAGIRAIIQPGGSIRDKLTIDLCNKYKIPMVFTGIRGFRH